MVATRSEVVEWKTIQREGWNVLLLGNGASIALHRDFQYETLHGVAEKKGLLSKAAPLFAKLGTTNFEHVLLACWYAEKVNDALGGDSPTITEAYEEVREALIEAVRVTHPRYAQISDDLLRVATYASAFQTVISLNYDLMLYWAMLSYNEQRGENWFKDAFVDGRFETDWDYLRKPHRGAKGATLVFYPHGNLALARNYAGGELKIHAGATDLLGAITRRWLSGEYVPIFVSEGTSEDKVAAIQRSRYLSTVFEKVMPNLEQNVVVYGWSFDEKDQHLLKALLRSPKNLAVSVYTEQAEDKQQAFCHHVMEAIREVSSDVNVKFFDSQSGGCWNKE
jgi:hypothetical protein